MTKIKLILFFLISNFLILIKTQEPITNAQRIFEFINYGPLGLLYGVLPTTLNELNITQTCQLSLNHLINSLHDGHLWANSMVASSGKGLQNLLEGSYLNLGNYDQCLSIESIKINLTELSINETTVKYFNSQYCVLDIIPQTSLLTPFGSINSLKQKDFLNPTLNVSQKLDTLFKFTEQLNSKIGFCLPSLCNHKDVTVLINSVLEEYLWKLKAVNCQTKQKLFKKILTDSNIETKISLLILLSLLSFVLLSTILDLIMIKNYRILNDLIKCFSLKNNFSKFLSPKYEEDKLILNVLQSLVILFCIISHSYLYFIWLDAYVIYDKIYDYLFNIKNIFYQPFLNVFDINTGLLFLIPSTFTCIKLFSIEITFKRCLKEIGNTIIINLLIMIVLICIQIILPVFITGPIANEYLKRDAKFCYQSWYKNLLFINNFNEFDKQCVLHSWIISTNLQFYTLLVLLIFVYSKVPILGKILNLFLIFTSIVNVWMIVYFNFLSPQLILMPINLNKLKIRSKLIHFPPYVHLLEYFLPCFVFNLISNKCNRFHVITRRTFLYLLILAFLIIQFYSFPFASLDYEGTNILNAFIIITCKTITPSLFAWIIYNYYGFNLEDIFKEIGLNFFNFNLFSSYHKTRNFNRKLNDLAKNHKNELEMVSNIKEENNKLMNNRNNKIIDDHLIINDKLIIDNLNIDILDKTIENDFLKLKLNEIILNENLFLTNLINSRSNERSIIKKVSFKNLFTIYTQLAHSIFYSHHFYLIYDLYTIRTSLATDFYSIISRINYNLFYIHLIAILFYLFIELPLCSIIKLIYKQIFNRKNI